VLTVHALERQSRLTSEVARTVPDRAPAREALLLAHRAVDEARYEPVPRLHALVATRHAQAASLLGDKAAFRSAITRARRELDRGPRASEPGWMWYMDETEISAYEAQGYWNLGELARSAKLYRSVFNAGSAPHSRAYFGAELSRVLLDSGAHEDAIREGNAVLSVLEGGVTSVRNVTELRPVRVAADGSRKSGAEEFCARFDAAEQALTAA